MPTRPTSVGLDVHARSVAAAAIDGVTGEVFKARLVADLQSVLDWLVPMPGPGRDRVCGRTHGQRPGASDARGRELAERTHRCPCHSINMPGRCWSRGRFRSPLPSCAGTRTAQGWAGALGARTRNCSWELPINEANHCRDHLRILPVKTYFTWLRTVVEVGRPYAIELDFQCL